MNSTFRTSIGKGTMEQHAYIKFCFKLGKQGVWSCCITMHQHTKSRLYAISWPKKSIMALDPCPVFASFGFMRLLVFLKLKLLMKGKRFDTISDIQKVSTETLKTILKNEFQECFKKFYNCFQYCTD